MSEQQTDGKAGGDGGSSFERTWAAGNVRRLLQRGRLGELRLAFVKGFCACVVLFVSGMVLPRVLDHPFFYPVSLLGVLGMVLGLAGLIDPRLALGMRWELRDVIPPWTRAASFMILAAGIAVCLWLAISVFAIFP